MCNKTFSRESYAAGLECSPLSSYSAQHHRALSTVGYVQQCAQPRNSSTQQSHAAGAVCHEDW